MVRKKITLWEIIPTIFFGYIAFSIKATFSSLGGQPVIGFKGLLLILIFAGFGFLIGKGLKNSFKELGWINGKE